MSVKKNKSSSLGIHRDIRYMSAGLVVVYGFKLHLFNNNIKLKELIIGKMAYLRKFAKEPVHWFKIFLEIYSVFTIFIIYNLSLSIPLLVVVQIKQVLRSVISFPSSYMNESCSLD